MACIRFHGRDGQGAEIALLHQHGVRFVGRAPWSSGLARLDPFDATLVAVGRQRSTPAGVPGQALPGVSACPRGTLVLRLEEG